MKNILFLVHRIPYPPNKGDKIRSYHFLKGLAENYHVHLASFVDDVNDWQYIGKVEELTESSLFINLNPKLAKIKSLIGLLTNKALTIPYYHSHQLQTWVDKTIEENKIEKIVVFSSAMAQFVQKYKHLDIIIDFVDVDSDKWLQYSTKKNWPMSWVYQRESRLLLEFDSNVAKSAKMNIFVSKDESLLFEQLTDVESKKISYVNNGVDTDFFDINNKYETPYLGNKPIIVFTGAMDYWANVDAVIWFVKQVFPLIRQKCKDAQFYIVGSKPNKQVVELSSVEGVFVTGRVEDIRSYLVFAHLVVAPLLIARGIQNKVLEAMAMGKIVVTTPQAIEGIKITDQKVKIEERPELFAQQVLSFLLEYTEPNYMPENREFVEQNFAWSASFKRLTQMID